MHPFPALYLLSKSKDPSVEVRGPEQYLTAERQLQFSRYRRPLDNGRREKEETDVTITFNVDMDIYGMEGGLARARAVHLSRSPDGNGFANSPSLLYLSISLAAAAYVVIKSGPPDSIHPTFGFFAYFRKQASGQCAARLREFGYDSDQASVFLRGLGRREEGGRGVSGTAYLADGRNGREENASAYHRDPQWGNSSSRYRVAWPDEIEPRETLVSGVPSSSSVVKRPKSKGERRPLSTLAFLSHSIGIMASECVLTRS